MKQCQKVFDEKVQMFNVERPKRKTKLRIIMLMSKMAGKVIDLATF